MDTGQELEEELAEQIDEQKAALEEVAAALDDDGENAELLQMQQELIAGVEELEMMLLGMKRTRLLQMLDQIPVQQPAPSDTEPGPAPSTSGHEGPPTHHIAPTHHIGPPTHHTALPGVAIGAACRFRYMDGRWYSGRLEGVTDGQALVRFLYPTRPFMLSAVQVPGSVVEADESPAGPHGLLAGACVLALPKGAQLWEPATVVGVGTRGAGMTLEFSSTGQVLVLPRERVGSPLQSVGPDRREAPSGQDEGSGSDEGVDEDEGEEDEDEDEDAEFSGRDWAASRGGGDLSDGGGRVGGLGLGLGISVMDHARQAAAAGPQTETVHFAEWETHSRGIASKLLAKMGYRQGSGLGSAQQGLATPLEVTVLPTRRGLGAAKGSAASEGKKRKKKRGGEKARKRKKMEAVEQAKEEVRRQRRQEEERGGAPGLFAFINNSLGDGSEAAQRLQVHRRDDVRGRRTAGSAGLNPPLQAHAGVRHSGKESRHALMRQQEQVAAIQGKVEQLKEMLRRNKDNKGLRVQIEEQMRQTLQQLDAAQAEQARVNKVVSSKESQKKWMKF